MAGENEGLQKELCRLRVVLERHAPEFLATLRPPVDEVDLESLRESVAPYSLPGEIDTWFRWADGQVVGARWWPSLECGPLLSASAAGDYYQWLKANVPTWQWNPLWLPIAHEGWNQAGAELAGDALGVIIDASFPEPPRVIAPTLTAMVRVSADMVEAGSGWPPDGDLRQWRQGRLMRVNEQPEWSGWPYDRELGSDQAKWPAAWRRAAAGAS